MAEHILRGLPPVLGNTALKTRRNGGELLATLCTTRERTDPGAVRLAHLLYIDGENAKPCM